MTKKLLFAAAMLLCLGTTAMAAKTVTIEIVGGSGKVMVNGKPYVPGTPVKSGAKIQVDGAATIKVGGVTIKTDGGTFQLSGSTVKVTAGTAQVTNAQGATQTVAKGDKVAVQTSETSSSSSNNTSGSNNTETSDTSSTTPPPPPPPNPTQDTTVSGTTTSSSTP